MNSKSSNLLPLVFMIASLAVLIGFNVFWVYKNFKEQKVLLQKELDNIFEKTVVAMQDSMIKAQLPSIDEIKSISVAPRPNKSTFQRASKPVQVIRYDEKKEISFHASDSSPKATDSTKNNIRVSFSVSPNNKNISADSMRGILAKVSTAIGKPRSSSAVFFVKIKDSTSTFGQDSSQQISVGKSVFNLLKPKQKEASEEANHISEVNKMQFIINAKPNVKNSKDIVFEIKYDSLNLNELRKKFTSKLAKNEIYLPFFIEKTPTKPKNQNLSGIQTQPQVAGNPFRFYTASFNDFNKFLINKIIPEMLFSLFLVGLTTLAFGLIYGNLKRQQRLTELKNDFIGNITHELKTPIATVSVAIEALSSFNVLQQPDKTKEYLEISKNELARLSMLVDKVLKMSLFEAKGLPIEKQNINFEQLLNSVLLSMKLQFEKHKATVSLTVEPADFLLEGDAVHLTNVIYNLLDNALKYSTNPSIEVTLQKSDRNELIFGVKDNGQGIAREFQDKIFEKFFRIPTGNIHNSKGHGLGLSYVQNVVQQHGGQIAVKSKLNEGAEFVVTLPMT